MSNDRKVAIAELVCRALADLQDPQGSTEKQIREYIQANYKNQIPDVSIKQYIATALKTGVAFGLISKKRGHYQLSKLVDNIRVISSRRSKRKAANKLPVRRVRTPAIRKTATKTRRNTRKRNTNTNHNKKSSKNYRFYDDDDDSQEQQNASDDYDEENIQQDDNEFHDNCVMNEEFDKDELTDNDEEMEADDQEEYDDDDNDNVSNDTNADVKIESNLF